MLQSPNMGNRTGVINNPNRQEVGLFYFSLHDDFILFECYLL